MPEERKYKRKPHGGIRKGKKPGSWIIDFVDYAGVRRSETHWGPLKEVKEIRANRMAEKSRINRGLEEAPPSKPVVVTLHQLWEAFTTDRQLKADKGSMSHHSLERCGYSYKAFTDYNSAQGWMLGQFKAVDFDEYFAHRVKLG